MARGRDNKGFTEHEMDIAVRVMSKSKIVRDWALGLTRAYGLEPDTPACNSFLDKKCMEQAQRIVR